MHGRRFLQYKGFVIAISSYVIAKSNCDEANPHLEQGFIKPIHKTLQVRAGRTTKRIQTRHLISQIILTFNNLCDLEVSNPGSGVSDRARQVRLPDSIMSHFS